jgi:hypothetical protein
LFALIVSAYVVTVIGIPVYLHYCGGELEKINYVMKGDSCCSGEEDDSEATDDGCCKDENLVLKSNADFTIKVHGNYDLVKTYCELFYLSLPLTNSVASQISFIVNDHIDGLPPKLQNDLLISTSVLRI